MIEDSLMLIRVFKMAVFCNRDKQFFPITNIQDAVELFRYQLEDNTEPNLALLSIVLGVIENNLTMHRNIPPPDTCSQLNLKTCDADTVFPAIHLSTVEALYQRFICLIRGSVDLTLFDTKYATRQLVKKVSDVVWAGLSRGSYKDKAHLQTLYTYLTGNKLDCFGLALAVVAACQQLGYNDVHLCLSEDHAWVAFGENGSETAEVTWHGKGNEDKRGQAITKSTVDKNWLYLNGHPVICDRAMEVVAMVAAVNPAINANMDSVEMAFLQQTLLWLLYDQGHLEKYPSALGNLGDLEEITPTKGRPAPVQLFDRAIQSTYKYYDNQHVYPYTYFGGYYYRRGMFKEAICYWAGAAQVISGYNYNREDEEIYKEFLEIANELIPHLIKVCVEHQHTLNNAVDVNQQESQSSLIKDVPLLQDPKVYKLLLTFYDGICEWEEGSSTPVLHITWANHLFHSLSKFDGQTREGLDDLENSDDEDTDDEETTEDIGKRTKRERRECNKDNSDVIGSDDEMSSAKMGPAGDAIAAPRVKKKRLVSEEEQIKTTIEELESKVGDDSQNETKKFSIADLAKACGDRVLNPEFLRGNGEPFTPPSSTSKLSESTESHVDLNRNVSSQSTGTCYSVTGNQTPISAERLHALQTTGKLTLKSAKMKGMKSLLLAAKLNSNAIKLQLTAQSQVHLKHSTTGSEYGRSSRKRSRRD